MKKMLGFTGVHPSEILLFLAALIFIKSKAYDLDNLKHVGHAGPVLLYSTNHKLISKQWYHNTMRI